MRTPLAISIFFSISLGPPGSFLASGGSVCISWLWATCAVGSCADLAQNWGLAAFGGFLASWQQDLLQDDVGVGGLAVGNIIVE